MSDNITSLIDKYKDDKSDIAENLEDDSLYISLNIKDEEYPDSSNHLIHINPESEIIQNKSIKIQKNKTKKYIIHSTDLKKHCVDLARKKDPKEVSELFNVPLKSLKRWILFGPERKKGGGRKIRDPEMEKKLYEWYIEYHINKNLPVTSRMIKSKALELTKLKDFNASKGWLEKIKKKYNLQISRPSSHNL